MKIESGFSFAMASQPFYDNFEATMLEGNLQLAWQLEILERNPLIW